jgi:dihydrodipicolinate reductase
MDQPINVLISGTGNMGREIVETIKNRDDMILMPLAFAGEEVEGPWQVDLPWRVDPDPKDGTYPSKYKTDVIGIVHPKDFESSLVAARGAGVRNIVAVEFGTPGTNNTPLFAKYGIPWVSGTTGVKDLIGNGVHGVNMAPPLIAIEHGLAALADDSDLAGCLKGFSGWFYESHQLYKKDPSGTRGKWAESLKKMGASLDMLLPERLEPRGHGYHKINMHAPGVRNEPLGLWAQLIEYMALNFREPFAGFKAELEETKVKYAINAAVKHHERGLGIGWPVPSRSAGNTGGAEVSNVYFTLPDNSARIAFYVNSHPERGTNAGFKTEVDGRAIYMPGIMAAIRYVHEQFYERGNTGMGIQSMMPVVKK